MSHTTAFRVLTLILILGDLESITVVNHHPDEEYFLEHEVLCEEAITEAKKLQLYPAGTDKKGPIPGCKPCTRSEMTYCKDGSVINDHCCCDGNSNETTRRAKICVIYKRRSRWLVGCRRTWPSCSPRVRMTREFVKHLRIQLNGRTITCSGNHRCSFVTIVHRNDLSLSDTRF
ncbi:uncharacterized protein LOC126875251 isoform X1 [Bombus huntii]|uniref:uncharacterized protein LOC126875251 isoform X1 n=1 Tax=Bombus huntii TaxID=85661 RepID=UPI0021AA59B2|nr:uncharacterized protein LOC126875251 isoform X1 [Bombus huntii]